MTVYLTHFASHAFIFGTVIGMSCDRLLMLLQYCVFFFLKVIFTCTYSDCQAVEKKNTLTNMAFGLSGVLRMSVYPQSLASLDKKNTNTGIRTVTFEYFFYNNIVSLQHVVNKKSYQIIKAILETSTNDVIVPVQYLSEEGLIF